MGDNGSCCCFWHPEAEAPASSIHDNIVFEVCEEMSTQLLKGRAVFVRWSVLGTWEKFILMFFSCFFSGIMWISMERHCNKRHIFLCLFFLLTITGRGPGGLEMKPSLENWKSYLCWITLLSPFLRVPIINLGEGPNYSSDSEDCLLIIIIFLQILCGPISPTILQLSTQTLTGMLGS